MRSRFLGVSTGALLFFALSPGVSDADLIDLTTVGVSVTRTGAVGGSFIVQQMDQQPTGTGFIDSFVRIQRNGSEQGYNTDLRPLQFDELTNATFTRSLQLSEIPVVDVGGTLFRQFLLDINQSVGGDNELLSLNQIQIFQSTVDRNDGILGGGSSSAPAVISFGAGATEVFRLNNSVDDFSQILLDYSLNSGSGTGDMYLLVRDDAFSALNSPFIILYSQFGSDPGASGTNDGFEEWAVVAQAAPVPAPAGILLFVTGAGVIILGRRRVALSRARAESSAA